MVARPSSVAHSDPEALGNLLAVHAPGTPHILDVTYNRGRIWKGLAYDVTGNDSDPQYGTLFNDDFRYLTFNTAAFDVIVFDPPHVTEARNGLAGSGGFAARYGTRTGDLDTATDISHLFEPFLLSAARVLKPGGIVIAKIANQVHRNAQRWQARAFLNTAERLGWTCCDEVVKVRKPSMTDPKWTSVHHVRKAHTFWLVIRHGKRC